MIQACEEYALYQVAPHENMEQGLDRLKSTMGMRVRQAVHADCLDPLKEWLKL